MNPKFQACHAIADIIPMVNPDARRLVILQLLAMLKETIGK